MGDLPFVHCVVLRSCCHFVISLLFSSILRSCCFPSVATEPIRSVRKWKSLALFCYGFKNVPKFEGTGVHSVTYTHDSCFLSFVLVARFKLCRRKRSQMMSERSTDFQLLQHVRKE